VITLLLGVGTYTWEIDSAPWHLGGGQKGQHRPYLEELDRQ